MTRIDPANGLEVPEDQHIRFAFQPKPSGWKCELFGMKGGLTLIPQEGQVPNRFWRWMQWLAFGNNWIKLP
jgi:hypothetical protein